MKANPPMSAPMPDQKLYHSRPSVPNTCPTPITTTSLDGASAGCRDRAGAADGQGRPGSARGIRRGQPGQGECGEEQAEVAQCHVAVPAEDEQIDDDPGEPQRHHVAADPRPPGHE